MTTARTATTVRNPWDNSVIYCRSCKNDQFYAAGRSLDLHNWECSQCGAVAHTMTETGMQA